MNPTLKYKFPGKIWLYKGGKASWHFISLPEGESKEIKFMASGPLRRGWGAVKVQVKIGSTNWKTSIFPDPKKGVYILPLKADIRKKENLKEGDTPQVELEVFV